MCSLWTIINVAMISEFSVPLWLKNLKGDNNE